MHTGLVTTPIVELWAQLQSAGYYKPGLLNLPADNALGSAGVDGLLKDTILFPGKALVMNVTTVQPPGGSIVLTGALASGFLGQDKPAAVVTFTVDGDGHPALTLVVAAVGALSLIHI